MAEDPLQDAPVSQGPVLARHTDVENMLGGQVADDPVQFSAGSQGPVLIRH